MLPAEPAKKPEEPIARAPVDAGRMELSGISYRIQLTFFL
jgi:hypothetical protein